MTTTDAGSILDGSIIQGALPVHRDFFSIIAADASACDPTGEFRSPQPAD